MMNTFAQFIDNNRQLGSTTELVKAALGVDGYVVVHNLNMKKTLLRKHSNLREDRVLTIHQIKRGSYPLDKRPIFFDAAVMCCVDV
jgi:hypothetical protein